MKKRYCFLLLLLLFASAAQAQNFRPFRPGAKHEFTQTVGDTVYNFRLYETGYLQGQDSVYYFHERVGPYLSPGGCRKYRYADNLFGNQLVVRRGGTMRAEYELVFADYPPFTYADSYLLRPRAPLNQPWNISSSLAARVTARGVQTVLGQPDSVATITFSNGWLLRLSKNHGLVQAPVLRDVVLRQALPRAPVRQLALTALPNQRLGLVKLTPQAIYDFQPGNVLWYSYFDEVFPSPNPSAHIHYDYIDSVMTRTTSRTGDTLTYRIWRCSPTQPYGNTYTLMVSSRQPQMPIGGTGEYVRGPRPSGGSVGIGGAMRDAYPSSAWNNKTIWRYDGRYYWSPGDSTCFYFSQGVDNDLYSVFAVGLGQIVSYTQNTTCCEQGFRLIGYRKGTENWGAQPTVRCRPLSVSTVRPAATTAAFPNPFKAELLVSFQLAQAQLVGISLHDALGREVLWKAAVPLPAGKQQLALATASQPAGVYSLHLRFGTEGRTEVLKVLKAD